MTGRSRTGICESEAHCTTIMLLSLLRMGGGSIYSLLGTVIRCMCELELETFGFTLEYSFISLYLRCQKIRLGFIGLNLLLLDPLIFYIVRIGIFLPLLLIACFRTNLAGFIANTHLGNLHIVLAFRLDLGSVVGRMLYLLPRIILRNVIDLFTRDMHTLLSFRLSSRTH